MERQFELGPLFGRDKEIADLATRSRRSRLTTLTGPGGTGKTRLARAVVELVRSDLEAFFVDMSAVTTGDDLAAAVASSLGVGDGLDPEGALHEWAQSAPRLVVLDNLEQIANAAPPIAKLLDGAPSLHLLATSRRPLGIRGEEEVSIRPLGLPRGDTLEELEASAAGAMFLTRARALGRLMPPLDITTVMSTARLCRRLDGLPLALELAASRTRILSPAAILGHLDAHDVSVLRRNEGESRHRSLAAVLDWSLGLLADEERQVLEACAVCVGTFDLPLLQAIVPEADVLLATESLVANGLIEVDEEVDLESRFRLLETVRLSSVSRMGGREHELRQRHAEALADFVAQRTAEMEGSGFRRAMAKLDADAQNLDSALAWATDHDHGLASRLARDTAPYWVRRRPLAAIGRLRELNRVTRSGSKERARGLAATALVLAHGGAEDEVRRIGTEAVQLARDTGERISELQALVGWLAIGSESADQESLDDRAVVQRIREIAPETPLGRRIRIYAECIAAFRDGGLAAEISVQEAAIADPLSTEFPGVTNLRANLAFNYLAVGRLHDAVAVGRQAIERAAEHGDEAEETFARLLVATASAELGNVEEAHDIVKRAVAIAGALGSPRHLMDVFRTCGTIAAIQGRDADAAWLLGAAQTAYAPSKLADPEVNETSGAARHWAVARRRLGAFGWELARLDGVTAGRDVALQRALDATLPRGARDRGRPTTFRHGTLTSREVEILTLVGQGKSDGEIAARLYISPKTASVHVANVKAKLGAGNRLETALRAREMGLATSTGTQTP